MFNSGRKKVGIGVVAGLLVTGVIGINALTVSGEEPTTEQKAAGALVLDVPGGSDRTATVKYFAADNENGVPDAVQTISASGPCETIVNSGDSLLRIDTTPASSRPVLPNEGLGILTGNQNCGTAGVIDRNESMVLSLDTFFDEFDDDVYVSTTTLEVFRPDNQGGNLRVGIDEGDLELVSPDLENGPNERTVAGFKESLTVSSTSPRFNKGIYLTGATFTLVTDFTPNQPPIANFDFDVNVREVEFTDRSTDADGTIASWEWDFGDGETSSDQSPTHEYAAAGTYTVTLTVTDDEGLASEPYSDDVAVEFEVALACNESLDAEQGDAATSATFFRLANGDKSEEEDVEDEAGCADIGAIIEIRSDYVFWNNSATGVNGVFQDPRALVTITWTGIDQDRPDGLQTFIDYFAEEAPDVDDPDFGYLMQWCESWDGEEAVMPIGPLKRNGEPETGVFDEDRVPWCLVSVDVQLDDQGKLILTQVIYGSGDPGKWL